MKTTAYLLIDLTPFIAITLGLIGAVIVGVRALMEEVADEVLEGTWHDSRDEVSLKLGRKKVKKN